MQIETSVDRFISDFVTVQTYNLVYQEAIFPIPDIDRATDDNWELFLHLPITKR